MNVSETRMRLRAPYRQLGNQVNAELDVVREAAAREALLPEEESRLTNALTKIVKTAYYPLNAYHEKNTPVFPSVKEAESYFRKNFGHLPPALKKEGEGYKVLHTCTGDAFAVQALLKGIVGKDSLGVLTTGPHVITTADFGNKTFVVHSFGAQELGEFKEGLLQAAKNPEHPLRDLAEAVGLHVHHSPENWLGRSFVRSDSQSLVAIAHGNLGNEEIAAGNFKNALNHYLKGRKIKPSYAGAQHGVGVSNYMLGNYPAAIKAHQAALKINSQDPNIHYTLGLTYKAAGQPQKAIESFQETLRLNPEHKEARAEVKSIT